MAAKKAKKASGRNVAEHERNTERVTIRLDPEAMDHLRHFAAAWKCSMAEVVSAALDSLNGDTDMQAVMGLMKNCTCDSDRICRVHERDRARAAGDDRGPAK